MILSEIGPFHDFHAFMQNLKERNQQFRVQLITVFPAVCFMFYRKDVFADWWSPHVPYVLYKEASLWILYSVPNNVCRILEI